MTTRARHEHGAYSPTSDGQSDDVAIAREAAREAAAAKSWWRPLIKPTEIAVGISLLMGGLSLAGFRRESPTTDIAREIGVRAKADSDLRGQIDSVKRNVQSLSDRLLFTNYLQCQAAKENHSALSARARADCDSIIQQRLAP